MRSSGNTQAEAHAVGPARLSPGIIPGIIPPVRGAPDFTLMGRDQTRPGHRYTAPGGEPCFRDWVYFGTTHGNLSLEW